MMSFATLTMHRHKHGITVALRLYYGSPYVFSTTGSYD